MVFILQSPQWCTVQQTSYSQETHSKPSCNFVVLTKQNSPYDFLYFSVTLIPSNVTYHLDPSGGLNAVNVRGETMTNTRNIQWIRVPESEKRNLLHYSLLHLHTGFYLRFHKQCNSSLRFCNSARWVPTSINTGYHTTSRCILIHSYDVFISNRIKNNVPVERVMNAYVDYKLYMSTILYPQFQYSKISENGKFRLIYNYKIQPVKKV